MNIFNIHKLGPITKAACYTAASGLAYTKTHEG